MKHSLQNDKGMASTLPTNYPGQGNNHGLKTTGATSAPSEKLLQGKPMTFKNAESSKINLKSYNFEE